MQIKQEKKLIVTFNQFEYVMVCAGLRVLIMDSCLNKQESTLVSRMLAKMEPLESEVTLGWKQNAN
jgi:hypothetical protein